MQTQPAVDWQMHFHQQRRERQSRYEAKAYRPPMMLLAPVRPLAEKAAAPITDYCAPREWRKRYVRPIGPRNDLDACPIPFIQFKWITEAVSRESRVPMTDIYSARRAAGIVVPRQIAMYLAKTLTLRSTPEIGRHFGGRDHTTVMHAFRKIAAMEASDPKLKARLKRLSKSILLRAHLVANPLPLAAPEGETA